MGTGPGCHVHRDMDHHDEMHSFPSAPPPPPPTWVPDSVFSAGKFVSSVDASYATSIDIEEVLSHARHSDFHIFVADVVKSFDTVDRDILDCALGRLGLPAWFRRVYFSFRRDVRLRFNLLLG